MFLKDAFASILSTDSAAQSHSNRSTPTKATSRGKKKLCKAAKSWQELPSQSLSPTAAFSPRPSLSPAPHDAVHAMSRSAASSATSAYAASGPVKPLPYPQLPVANSAAASSVPSRMNSTIRPVDSFESKAGGGGGDHDHSDQPHKRVSHGGSSTEDDSATAASLSASRISALSSSFNSNASGASGMSQPMSAQAPSASPQTRQSVYPSSQLTAGSLTSLLAGKRKSSYVTGSDGGPSGGSHGARTLRLSTERGRSSVEVPQRESSLSATTPAPSAATPIYNAEASTQRFVGNNYDASQHQQQSQDQQQSPADGTNGWDSSVGKAGLGKTGRVINRLVSDNEALKRDINLERLRAEEAKQTARLLEDKMERLVSDYEGRLLDASVNKTLLARKERQVETLQAAVDLERQRAADAVDREKTWKGEMERAKAEAKVRVEKAETYAALLDGRYNAISSHWRDQGEQVDLTVAKLKADIDTLVVERRKDDDKIHTLRELCDQQDANIRDLCQQKEEIAAQFDRYKAEQEKALRDIKVMAQQTEEAHQKTLEESREVLHKLKWALNVKENVGWAQ